MNLEALIHQLNLQRDRVNEAIDALKSNGGRQSRPRRNLSADARRRISQAQKRRWAAQKKK